MTIYFDMDGTIVSYRKAKLDQEGNSDFVNSQLFFRANNEKTLVFVNQTNFVAFC